LLFRLINYWSIVLIGFVLYILTKRPINVRMNPSLAQGKE